MPTSYQGGARRVNAKPPASISPPGDSSPPRYDRNSERPTATFVPYFWEAYNEIVEPRRIDHYLIRKWLPSLGTLGFALVKILRDRCYHNPATGILRDSCELDMEELAAAVGVSDRTIQRELKDNGVLGQFVRRIEQRHYVDGISRQRQNLYQICMDDPIHPDDMERYDDLRALKEQQRDAPVPKRISYGPDGKVIPEKPERQIVTLENPETAPDKIPERQIVTQNTERQNVGATERQIVGALKEDLLKSLLTKESLTPHEAASPHKSPQGEKGEAPPGLVRIWPAFLSAMAEVTTTPTFHTHIATLVPHDLIGDEVAVIVPSAFTREWIEKRHRSNIESALSAALGRRVTLRLVQMDRSRSIVQLGKQNNG